MVDACCQTCDEGALSCTLATHEQSQEQSTSLSWQRLRSGVMFSMACLTSPCCTPLYIPLVLVLVAGTPVAAWLTLNVGWVYGILTALSLFSLMAGLYGMQSKATYAQTNIFAGAGSARYALECGFKLAKAVGYKIEVIQYPEVMSRPTMPVSSWQSATQR